MRTGYEDPRKDEAFRNPRAKAIAIIWAKSSQDSSFSYSLLQNPTFSHKYPI